MVTATGKSRNAAAGSLRQLDPKMAKERDCHSWPSALPTKRHCYRPTSSSIGSLVRLASRQLAQACDDLGDVERFQANS